MADEACKRVRSGFGGGYACRVHGRTWPCRVREQPAEQLAMLHRASPLAPPVLLEVAAERLRQLDEFPAEADDLLAGHAWIELLVEYLNRAGDAGKRIRDDVAAGGVPDLAAWRHRLIQVAAVASAAVESCDRVIGPPSVGDEPGTEQT